MERDMELHMVPMWETIRKSMRGFSVGIDLRLRFKKK